MKKLLSLVVVMVLGFSLYAVTMETSSATPISTNDYCPSNTVCVGTNLTAKRIGGNSKVNEISGISVYKIDGKPVAEVPGHGKLSIYYVGGGWIGWHFQANDSEYYIPNLRKDI